jgi:hypothetical protein
MWSTIIGSILSILAPATTAPATAPANDQPPTVLVVVGAEGTPEYGREFAKWADRWAAAAQKRSATFIRIGSDAENPEDDRKRFKDAIDQQAKDSAQPPLWIVLIGHGTYDGREAKFNLRGPDVSDQELAEWLKPFERPLAVIDCTAASAPFLTRLSGKGRILITATRSGSEINFARFGDYFSTAIADPAADLDKDGQTSLLEAFLAASHRVEEAYKQDGRLATEHAILDDNGDALGIGADWFEGLRATRSARDGAPLDGPRAHQWHLVLSPAEQALSAEVRARRDELELAIESLRQKKPSMSEGDYYSQLEKILIELARLYQNPSKTAGAESPPAIRPTTAPE